MAVPGHLIGYGPSRPCPAWAFGVRVFPGPDWDNAGHGHQDVLRGQDGVLAHVLGVTKIPTRAVLDEWAEYIIMAIAEGWSTNGGFAPHRSSYVQWGPELFRPLGGGPEYFYRSGDMMMYDLSYIPWQDPINVADNVSNMARVYYHWEDLVTTKSMEAVARMASQDEKTRFELAVQTALNSEFREFQHVLAEALRPEVSTPSRMIFPSFPVHMIVGKADERPQGEEHEVKMDLGKMLADDGTQNANTAGEKTEDDKPNRPGATKRRRKTG